MVKVRQRGRLHRVVWLGLALLKGAGKGHHFISVHQVTGTLLPGPQSVGGAVPGPASSQREADRSPDLADQGQLSWCVMTNTTCLHKDPLQISFISSPLIAFESHN